MEKRNKAVWNVGNNFAMEENIDLIDKRMAKQLVGDLQKQMGSGPLQPHKPVAINAAVHRMNVEAEVSGIKNQYVSGRKVPGKNDNAVNSGGLITRVPKQALGAQPIKKAPKSLDNDLLSSMAARLNQLEQANQQLKLQNQEANLRSEKIKEENANLKLLVSQDGHKELTEIKKERDDLQAENVEMKKFLKDYGLKWVGGEGGKHEGAFAEKALKQELKHDAPAYKNNLPAEIDTEILSRRIEELNFIAEKQMQITMKNGMNQFKKQDPVHIYFYQNGLMIQGRAFAPYYSKTAQSILTDILDGYFPYDLKQKYPSGVPLKPVDLCDEIYGVKKEEEKKSHVKEFKDLDASKGPQPLSKKEFLNQFPSHIMQNGKAIPIREELEKKFKETGKIDTSKLNSNEPIEIDPDFDVATTEQSQIVNLRIRTETGKRNIILKLLVTDNMAKIYDLVEPYSEREAARKFELRTNFPNKAYGVDEVKNLKDLGLAPSSVLIMKAL